MRNGAREIARGQTVNVAPVAQVVHLRKLAKGDLMRRRTATADLMRKRTATACSKPPGPKAGCQIVVYTVQISEKKCEKLRTKQECFDRLMHVRVFPVICHIFYRHITHHVLRA